MLHHALILLALAAPPDASGPSFHDTMVAAHESLVRCDPEAVLELVEVAGKIDAAHPGPWVYRAAAFLEKGAITRDDGFKQQVREAVARAIELGEAAESDSGATAEELFFLGLALGFESTQQAERREWVRAARTGKRVRSLGHEALSLDPEATDAYLLTGTYDYLVAALPRLVRFLSFFLALPAGDKERGIHSLERAMEGGGLASRQAGDMLQRILLHENRDERAVGVGEALLARRPDDGRALLLLAKAHLEKAEWDTALAQLERVGSEDGLTCLFPEDLWEARLLRGIALVNGGRAGEGLALLESLDAEGDPPPGTWGRSRELLVYARAAALDRLGRRSEAAPLCRSLAENGRSKEVRRRAKACRSDAVQGAVPAWFRL